MDHRSFVWIYILLLLPLTLFHAILTVAGCFFQAFKPTAESIRANNAQALRRGFPLWFVETLRMYQHLTIWTMTIATFYVVLLEIGYRYHNHDPSHYSEWVCPIRTFLPTAGMLVANYWTFIFVFGVWSLVPREDFPKDDEKANDMANRLFKYPSCSLSVILYIIMHIQHTFLPVMTWLEYGWYPSVVNDMCPVPSFFTEWTHVVSYLTVWLLWGMMCWYVRGTPPYPIMRTMWRNGQWRLLYGSIFVLGTCIVYLSQQQRRRQLVM